MEQQFEAKFAIRDLDRLEGLVERIEALMSDDRLDAVQILSPKPGDVIALSVSDRVTWMDVKECREIQERAQRAFGDGVKVVVLNNTLKMQVVRGDAR